MRRRSKDTQKGAERIVDVKREVPARQLASIGALTLTFNEVEAFLDQLFFAVTDLPETLQWEVSTRLQGIDGKIEIVKKGAALYLDPEDLNQLGELLGDGVFSKLKSYRDGVIHVRHLNVKTGVGIKVDKRASIFEYLVAQDSLDKACDLLLAVQRELAESVILALLMKSLKRIQPDDPRKEELESVIPVCRSQFRRYRTERQSLPLLPAFPTESELHAADLLAQQAQTAALMSWYQQPPAALPQRNNALLDTLHPAWAPQPPPDDKPS